jgi:hypothetical protein
MDDPVPDDDVRGPHVNPLLPLELGEQSCADGVVVAVGRDGGLALGHRQRPHEVRPAHDAGELAVAKHRNAFDSFGLEQGRNVGEVGRASSVTKRHSPAAAVSATEFGEAAEPFIQGRGSSREYPATSAARIAARRRVVAIIDPARVPSPLINANAGRGLRPGH